MHELAVCEAIMAQAALFARQNGYSRIDRVVVALGPLSGVEPSLLMTAFPLVSAAAGYAEARLEIDVSPVRVSCRECGAETEAAANRLLCGKCGGWNVSVSSGADAILQQIEFVASSGGGVH